MKQKTKTIFIQLTGLVLCLCCAVIGIMWHIQSQKPAENEDTPTQDVLTPGGMTEPSHQSDYNPLNDIKDVTIPDAVPEFNYDYYTQAKNYNMASALKSSGYKLTEGSYDSSTMKIGAVSKEFSKDFSETTHKVQKAVKYSAPRGGYETRNEEVTEDAPLLVPYYGYIIYTDKSSVKLLDSNGNTLVSNLKGYTPAYATDYAGNPLFEKDGKYYFYYNGKSYNGTLYTKIKNDDFKNYPTTVPTAYQYFQYDIDMLNNLFVTNDFTKEANAVDMVYILPDKAGMVEYKADKRTLIDIALPSQSYNTEEGKLFRFPAYTYTKTESKKVDEKPYYTFEVSKILWGYMDAKGNTVIPPQFKKAYNFNNGYALVEDIHGHVCVIDEKGKVAFNAYDSILYFPELGNQKIRDGHYLPDTYGVESSGMLAFDRGFVRMRRKLVDTEHGFTTKWEYEVLCDTKGNTLNLPTGCELVGYSDGIMLLKKGEKYGYMKTNGDWLIEPVLAVAKPFSEGLAVMGYTADKLGMIDTNGNVVLYNMYKHIESSSGGVITAYSEVGGWSIFNKMTNKKQTEVINPVIALKERAIAEAKFNFYAIEERE